jgi:hypothetical protein
MRWISTSRKLLKNQAPTFCCPLSELSYVLLKMTNFAFWGRNIRFETKMQFFDVLIFLVRTPDIVTHCVVYRSYELIVVDNLSLITTHLVLSWSRYIPMYASVRQTLLVMKPDNLMSNTKLGYQVSLSNCLT